MRIIDLKLAVSEIKQAVEDARKRGRPSPFFFVAGAGISNPPVPLAGEIQEDCKRIALEYGRPGGSPSPRPGDAYSHWFSQAYPQPEQRQRYLRDLMEKAFISRANFRLAHLLLESTVSNLVFTTNFDDFLSRALTLFGKQHIVCDHPNTVERIDLESPDTQIVHVHGSYWFYDCCNLKEEVERRAQLSGATSFTIAQLLDGVLWSRSPLVLGYSGWDGDIFMSALKRRLSVGLRTNLYWFCYRRANADGLPDWLTRVGNVTAVLPPESRAEDAGPASRGELPDGEPPGSAAPRAAESGAGSGAKAAETPLSATAVLDDLVRAFGLSPPKLTQDPLGFFAEQLKTSLIGDRPDDEGQSDVYSIRGVIEQVLGARKLQRAAPTSKIAAELEAVRDASRRSDYRAAVRGAGRIRLEELGATQLRELLLTMAQAGAALWDNSPDELLSYDLVLSIADKMESAGATDPAVVREGAKALYNKGLTLGVLNRSEEEIAVYDEVVRRYGDATEAPLREQVAKALVNKGITLGSLNRSEEEIAVYDEVVRRYGEAPEAPLRERVAKALVNKGITLGSLNRSEEAIAAYDEVVRRYGEA
ncbi:MAG: SIR2 family protein, partial [Bryobacteraceae bacterium]